MSSISQSFKIQHLIYALCLLISLYSIFQYHTEVVPVWERKITEQKNANKNASWHSEKLGQLKSTIMPLWESAYENIGTSDRVSLSRRLNINETTLTPQDDVPQIFEKSSVSYNVGSVDVPLGLVKVCFGRGKAGYGATANSISELIWSMKQLEKKESVDFDRFTLRVQNDKYEINIFDMCVFLKDEASNV